MNKTIINKSSNVNRILFKYSKFLIVLSSSLFITQCGIFEDDGGGCPATTDPWTTQAACDSYCGDGCYGTSGQSLAYDGPRCWCYSD